MASSSIQKLAEEAADRGDVEALRQCFRDGASPIDLGVYLDALQHRDTEIFQVILDAGGMLNLDMEYSGTPLIIALDRNYDAFFGIPLFKRG